jgi:hypothetical protein
MRWQRRGFDRFQRCAVQIHKQCPHALHVRRIAPIAIARVDHDTYGSAARVKTAKRCPVFGQRAVQDA